MKRICHIASVFLLLLVACKDKAQEVPETPLKALQLRGCDMSFLPRVRASGMVVRNLSGQAEDMLTTLKNAGVNMVRLRIWNDPADGHSGFVEVKNLSSEIHSKGLQVFITVHFSGTWADPGKQTKPAAWDSLTYQQLKDSVYGFTKKIMTEIHPDIIEIGNEINNGFLWPEGNISNLPQMLDLLSEGIRAVRDNSQQARILMHYAGYQEALAFYDKLAGLDYDIIGLSYYPYWHGKDLEVLQSRLNTLGQQFNKDVMIAETSYPFTLGYNDYTNNVIGDISQILPAFYPDEGGQANFVKTIRNMVADAPRGIGICYWGAEWIAFMGPEATDGSSWENQALWDFSNQALKVVKNFRE